MSTLRHLYNSRGEILRLSGTFTVGSAGLTWGKITDIVDAALGVPGELMARLDLTFLRVGRDAPMPVVAGVAPDRTGVMVFDTTPAVKAGDRFRCLAGPVTGTFEIRSVPDVAVAFADAHHMEVQVFEVAQTLHNIFPGADIDG